MTNDIYINNSENKETISSNAPKMKDSLKKRIKFLDMSLMGIKGGVIVLNEGRIEYISDDCKKLFGYSSVETLITAKGILPDSFLKKLRSISILGVYRKRRIFLKIRKKSGKKARCVVSISPYIEEDITRHILILIDVSSEDKMRNRISYLKEKQERLSQMLLISSEVERDKIAAEIHDNFSQMLSVLKMRVMLHEKNKAIDLSHEKNILEKLLLSASNMALSLRPSSIKTLGLEYSVAENFKMLPIESEVVISKEAQEYLEKLSDSQIINIFRIAQESSSNAIKHGFASKIVFLAKVLEKSLIIQIYDNGRGFNPKNNINNKGIGLTSMRARSKIIGAGFKLKSEIGCGCEVSLILPHSRIGDVTES